MAGRFPLITDVHISKAAVKAVKTGGWSVVRVVDVDELGQEAPDEVIFEYASKHGLVFVSSDEAAQGRVHNRLKAGRSLPGMVVWAQRHHKTVSPGAFVRFLEGLAQEQHPFAYPIRHVRPDK